MKILLTLFVLLFSSPVVAEDISDFEIKGISLEDSLLDFFKERDIKRWLERDKKSDLSPIDGDQRIGDKFQSFYFFDYFGETEFGDASFYIKPNDKKYIIYGMGLGEEFDRGSNGCHIKLEEISDQISLMFPNIIENKGEFKFTPDDPPWCLDSNYGYYDDTVTYAEYKLDKGIVYIDCYCEGLHISIRSNELVEWLND